MKRANPVGVAIVFVVAASFPTTSLPDSPNSITCAVTRYQGGMYGNDALRIYPPVDGRLVFQPGGSGFVDRDGALGIKFAFERRKKGRLFVGGRRLDGPAGPARAYISDYGDSGFQPIYLVFPAPGCWEITGGVAGATLTFVVLVEKIGDGPSWRFKGPARGWRVTTSFSGT